MPDAPGARRSSKDWLGDQCPLQHLATGKSACYTRGVMNHHDRGRLKFLILFSTVFAASSFFFSLLSWGRAGLGPRPEMLQYVSGGVIDLVEHAALGALAALPTRKKLAIVVCALATMLIDVDHIGFMVGLPTQGRASHGVPFAVAVFLVVFLLARKGIFGQQIRPLVLASLALASVVAHLAWDAINGGTNFPLWMPLSDKPVFVSPFGGILLELTAAGLLWAVTMRRNRRGEPKQRQTRNNVKVQKSLQELKKVASCEPDEEHNLMPYIMEVVKSYATIGEIRTTLQEVWGEHKESNVF